MRIWDRKYNVASVLRYLKIEIHRSEYAVPDDRRDFVCDGEFLRVIHIVRSCAG